MRPKKTNIPIIKQAKEELKQATFLILPANTVDLHGDIYDTDEVRKACHSYNLHCRKANLLHLFETDTFSVVESYISPVDVQIGEQLVKAGDWLAVFQFNDDDIWEGVKSGEYTGASIGATATVEELEDNNDKG